MSRTRVLVAAAAVFGGAMTGAWAWDCARLVRVADDAVAEADREVRRHEERLLSALAGFDDDAPELRHAAAAYRDAHGGVARRRAYGDVVAAARRVLLARNDPTDPLARRFADDVAGALNRRDVADRHFDEVVAACRALSGSFRGRLGRRVSGRPTACDSHARR